MPFVSPEIRIVVFALAGVRVVQELPPSTDHAQLLIASPPFAPGVTTNESAPSSWLYELIVGAAGTPFVNTEATSDALPDPAALIARSFTL